jgi:hypothetical protein
MKKEEAINYVIQELGKHKSQNDIIVALCQQTGMAWSQAEQFVNQVQAEHQHDISSRQSPLLIGISVGLIIVGLGLIFSNVDYFMGLFNQDVMGLALSARSAVIRIGSILTGLGMAVGGSIGLREPISELLNKQGG